MEWEKASVELGVELSHLLAGFNCLKKSMFGSPCYFVNGNMFTGVKGGIVFLRLSEDGRKAIMLESDEIQPFEPRPGFFMKEYVEIPDNKITDQEFITRWLNQSYDFIRALPPKVKKAKHEKH